MPDPSVEAPVRRVPFSELPGFPALFVDYCRDYEAVSGYYAGDPRSPEARRAAADRAAAVPRDRDALADALLEQNARWGLGDGVRAGIEALRHPDTVAIVTGQQVGLFTGPLFTVYKTLTTVLLARQVSEETGRTVVPVFWLPGEDHDLAEVQSTVMLHRNEPTVLRYQGHTLPPDGNLGPVGRLALTDAIEEVVVALDETLAPTDFKDEVMARVREAYQPGVSLEDAFARLLRTLFPDDTGLVFVSGDDARLKRLAAPLFRRELEDPEALAEGLRAVSKDLEARYHAQVHIRPTNLFLLDVDGAGRYGLDAEGTDTKGFTLRGNGHAFTQDELSDLLAAAPERFSPNVVMRPLMQDLLFPTVAYVAGPGELSYFAQYKPAYEWAGLPMPLIYPRISISLVESKVQKVLDKYGLTMADLRDDLDTVFQRLVVEGMEVDVEAAFKEASRSLHQAINTLKPEVEAVDATLGRTAEATRAALARELDKFKERVVRAEKRNQDEVRAQLEKAFVNLTPYGKLQERVFSVLYYLNKYSPSFVEQLADRVSLDTTAHQVLEL